MIRRGSVHSPFVKHATSLPMKKMVARSAAAKRQQKNGSDDKAGDRPQRIMDQKIAGQVADSFDDKQRHGKPPGPKVTAQKRTRREQHGRAKTEQKHA